MGEAQTYLDTFKEATRKDIAEKQDITEEHRATIVETSRAAPRTATPRPAARASPRGTRTP